MTIIHGPVVRRGLTPQELADVRDLAEEVRQADDVELKLNWELMTDRRPDEAGDFCYYIDGRLVGYAPLDGEGEELEVTAAVSPAFRRRGIFRTLLDMARKEALRCGAKSLLLVGYRASASGTATAQALRLPYRFSEYRMEADSTTIPELPAASLTLVQVGEADVTELARLTTLTFGSERRSAEAFAEELRRPGVRYFFAERDGIRIGQIGVIDLGESVYIRGVGILPEQRHRGNGRQLLAVTVQTMLAEGHTRFSLDVATENARALSLYESCGFRATNIYDYYDVPLM